MPARACAVLDVDMCACGLATWKTETFMLEADDYSALMHSVRRDVHWLRSCGLMDYSLIVGILHRCVSRQCTTSVQSLELEVLEDKATPKEEEEALVRGRACGACDEPFTHALIPSAHMYVPSCMSAGIATPTGRLRTFRAQAWACKTSPTS